MIKPKAYYENFRSEIAALVPSDSLHILDVGCGAGNLGASLIAKNPAVTVVGVEVNPEAAAAARQVLTEVWECDIEKATPHYPHGYFDVIVCADSIEHLRDPEPVLQKLLTYLSPTGSMIFSIPNLRHQSVIFDLLVNGKFEYKEDGILDCTHLRFFTRISIAEMLDRLNLQVEEYNPSLSQPHPAMEPLFKAVGDLGGDTEALREESRIVQFIFRCRRIQ